MFLSTAIDTTIHSTLSYIFCHIELINRGEQKSVSTTIFTIKHQNLELPLLTSAIAACWNANGKYGC